MTSTRSKADLDLCVICGDKTVTVGGDSETGRRLITNLLRCLSLVQLNGEALENINLCFKCENAVEEWTYAQGEGATANPARKIKAGFLVKILEESTRKSCDSWASSSSLVEKIQRMIFDRFNVAVNVDRLELSSEEMDRISRQQLIRHQILSHDPKEYEVQDDFKDDSSSGGSSSDAQIWEDESDDEVVEIPAKRTRTCRFKKIDYNDNKYQLITSEKNDIKYVLTRRPGRPAAGAGQADINAVEKFQKNHPMPPDFIPQIHKPGSYLYGKCSVKEYDSKVECCECSLSVPMETDGLSSWWKIREHMRNEHPELVPCIPPKKELGVKSLGQDKFQYGQATMTKFLAEDVECYKCDACGESYRTKFARQCCFMHIRRYHRELALFNPYYHEKPVYVNQNIIRYAAAYLEKLGDTNVRCQVCSFVYTGQHAQKTCINHVRKLHSILAPVELSAVSQANSEAVQSSNTEMVDNNATSLPVSSVSHQDDDTLENSEDEEESEVLSVDQARQDDIDVIQKFQLKNPIPPDFIPDTLKSGCYQYGKCSAEEVENEVKCCECSFSVSMATCYNGVSSWWKIREHMRTEHPKLVPCSTQMKDLGLKLIGRDKYQCGQATITKFMESDVVCYKCDPCGKLFRKLFAKKACVNHIRNIHPEMTPPNPYFQEKAIYMEKNLIRYAAAYLVDKGDTEIMCQVCSQVSTGQHVLQSSISHVRNRHPVLAPVKIGRQNDSMESVETFQLNHPIPPDFIPQIQKPGSYLYGKCSVKEYDSKVECCECSLSVPMETDGLSSWWKIREHMRNEHPELVPCIPPKKELGVKSIGQDKFQYGQATMTKFLEEDNVECYKCDACEDSYRTKCARQCCISHMRTCHPELALFNPYYHEKPVFVNQHLIRYAAAYLEKLSDTKVMCQVCSVVYTGQHAQKTCINHVRKLHSILAPVEISAVFQTNSEAVHSSNTEMVDNSVLNADQFDDTLGNSEDQEESEVLDDIDMQLKNFSCIWKLPKISGNSQEFSSRVEILPL